MEYTTLKNSNLRVSRICMGGCPMGQYGWGDVSEKELLDAVETAIDRGMNFFDTADTYGLGKSEEVLSRALGTRRHNMVIATKFGVRTENGKTRYDNSPEWIETALFESLRRLNTDYIDLYQIHYRDGKTPMDTIVETLERLKQRGQIRFYGLSNIHEPDMAELEAHVGKFVSMQNEYSLACRSNENELTAMADTLQVTPMTWGSLGQGILSGKYGHHSVFEKSDRRSREIYVNFHGEKLKKNLQIVEAMRPIAKEHGVSVPAVAIRFILDHLMDSVVLVGVKKPAQILANMEADGWQLSQGELRALTNISG